MNSKISVRPATADDAAAMAEILNEIIRVGGTTAQQTELSVDQTRQHYIAGPDTICCHVAIGPGGEVIGFQALGHYPTLPDDIGDIGTFARQTPKTPGVGRALFPVTAEAARALGLTAINAVIRADNVPGLAYYATVGFTDFDVMRAHPLSDGTLVDRIVRRYPLT